MPKNCAKMIAFMGLSAASVALHGSWYEPSKVPTQENPYNYPRSRTFKGPIRSFAGPFKGPFEQLLKDLQRTFEGP